MRRAGGRRRALLLVGSKTLVLLLACGGGPYDDWAHGLTEKSDIALERFYRQALDLPDHLQVRERAARLLRLALAAERDRDWNGARQRFGELLAASEGLLWRTGSVELRWIKDRIDVLALAGQVADTDLATYCRWADGQHWPQGWPEPLVKLLEPQGGGLARRRAQQPDPVGEPPQVAELEAAVIATRAWRLGQDGHHERAAPLWLGLASGVAGVKSDEIAYRVACLPWRLGQDRPVEDLVRPLLDYAASGGAWAGQALGWAGHLRYRHAGIDAALPIYWELLDRPRAGGCFAEAVSSLRLLYNRRPIDPIPAGLRRRHLFGYLVFQADDHWRWQQPHAQVAALAGYWRRAVGQAPDPALFSPRELVLLAQVALSAGDGQVARELVAAARQRRPDDARVAYWSARLAADADDLATALSAYQTLVRVGGGPTWIRDAALRIAQLQERRGDPLATLRWCLRAGSGTDLRILADGVVALDDLVALVAEGPPTVDQGRRTWRYHGDPGLQRELRHLCGIRLVRHGRVEEALPLLDPPRQALARELLSLEADRDGAATAAERARSSYALAAFWYHRGRDLAFVSRHWHQWADRAELQGRIDPAAAAAERQAMNPYWRAATLFAEVHQQWPDRPEAPRALYSEALCWYWLCGDSRLGSSRYWHQRATAEGFWQRGHERMRQLQQRYPDHPLARSSWMEQLPDR